MLEDQLLTYKSAILTDGQQTQLPLEQINRMVPMKFSQRIRRVDE